MSLLSEIWTTSSSIFSQGLAWKLKFQYVLINWIQNYNMPWGVPGNLLFAIIARMLCGNHLKFWGGEFGFCTLWQKQNLLVFTIFAGTFWQIQLDICTFLSRIVAFCEPGWVNRGLSADFWVNFRRSALDIWANVLEGGRSKWRGLAVKACFSKQPRDILTVGGCQKHRASWRRVLVWDFDCS